MSYSYDPVRVRTKYLFGTHSTSKSFAGTGTKAAITTISSTTDSLESSAFQLKSTNSFQSSSAPVPASGNSFDGSYPFGMVDDNGGVPNHDVDNARPKGLCEKASGIDEAPPVNSAPPMPHAQPLSVREPVEMHGHKQDLDPTEWKPKEPRLSAFPPAFPEKSLRDGNERDAMVHAATFPDIKTTVGDLGVGTDTQEFKGNETKTKDTNEYLPSWLPTLCAKAHLNTRNGLKRIVSTSSQGKNRVHKSAAHDYLSRFQHRRESQSLNFSAADDLRRSIRRGSSTNSSDQSVSLTTSASTDSAKSQTSASTRTSVSEQDDFAVDKARLTRASSAAFADERQHHADSNENVDSSSVKDIPSFARSTGLGSPASSLSSDYPLITPSSSFRASPPVADTKYHNEDHHIDVFQYELEE